MPGYSIDSSGVTTQNIVYADNVDFTGTPIGGVTRQVTANGQLLIGNSVFPNIRTGTITSPLGTLSIGYSAPNITLDIVGGAVAIEKIALQTGTTPVVPSGGIITFNGAVVAAGTNPVRTNGTGANTMALQVQTSQAIASTNATNVGLAAFNSAQFSVDANGFVSATGSVPIQFTGNSGTATPSAGNINIFAASTAAGTSPATTSATGSTVTVNIQKSQAIASTNASNVGLAAFDSARFSVDANGFVTINGAGVGETITGQSGGALSPTAGNWNISGATVAAGTSPLVTAGSGSTLTINAQRSQAIASTDATKVGLAAFDSADFTVDANGFVSAATTGFLKTLTGTTGGAIPPTANNINILAASVAAGTTPIAVAGSGSTLTINVQKSQAIAASDATKIGLSNFDSNKFTVDANGFVSLNGSGVAQTITGDSGGALSPSSGNWNIVGLSGSKTSGSGSTLTVKSPPFSQVGASATSVLNTGEFITAAVTRTLPASAGLADGDLFIYICTTAGALIIQAVTAQKIRMGTLLSSAAGTATSTQIGDCITLRFNGTDGFFYATNWVGTWLIA